MDICLSQAAILDNFAKKLFNVNEPLLENIDKHISLSMEKEKCFITLTAEVLLASCLSSASSSTP
jgi:hypothetical protein